MRQRIYKYQLLKEFALTSRSKGKFLSKYKTIFSVGNKLSAFESAQNTLYRYHEKCSKWDEAYGEKATSKAENMHEKIQRYRKRADKQNTIQTYRNRNKGAR